MDKYAQLKRFHHDRQLQVYIYAFMYVDNQTMPAEYHLTTTKKFVEYSKKFSTVGTVPKYWLGFSYILSRGY